MGSEASIGWPNFSLLTRVASRRVSKTSLKSFTPECETEMLEHPICVELSPLPHQSNVLFGLGKTFNRLGDFR